MLTPARAGTPRSAVRHGRIAAGLAGMGLALALTGCATTSGTAPPRTGSAASRPAPGYERRADDLSSVDASSLAGRRIALDPGHGGFFRGALGVDGLTEAEVNLGVALNLRGLLEARGASVFLTRSDDRDFLTPSDSSLRADLAERSRLASAFSPDLFVSIHHNADARGAHDVNETQTYYKLGDEGPSLEAAADVHRFLVRNLGIAKHRLVPGNYFVLRNSAAPALLTESSYITNPDVEKKLALAAKQRLEAEALFLGIATYFARRAPVIEEFRAFHPGYPGADSSFVGTPSLRGRIAGAFDEVRLAVDGRAVEPPTHGGDFEWTPPQPLAVGDHEATLAVRLAGEGTARTRTLRFHVVKSPGKVVAEFPYQLLWRADQPLGLKVRVLDDDGLIRGDSIEVRVRNVGSVPLAPADTQIVVADGAGWVYFRAVPRRASRANRRPSSLEVRVGLSPPLTGEFEMPLVEDARITIATWGLTAPPTRTTFALLMPEGVPLRGAPGTSGPDPEVRWINRDGFVCLPRDSSGAVRVPALAGYRRWPSDSTWPPRFTALCGGALHGRRITLDPAGGGDEAGGTGPSGTRAANLNLEVARALAAMLRGAGAEVKLTREGDYALSEVERVQVSEAFHADRFLRIGHAPEPPMLGYYFSSAAGRHWAEGAAAAFTAIAGAAPRLAEDAQYPLQQTSCPALYASPARVDEAASETRLLAPGTLRGEAYALYLALAREWAIAADWPADSIEVRDPAGRPLAGAAVTLGEALVLESDASGRIRFARTEPGPTEVRVEDVRLRARSVLLESQRGLILTGPAGR